jgi:hypothetical protein
LTTKVEYQRRQTNTVIQAVRPANQRERTTRVERVFGAAETEFDEHAYPVNSDESAAQYRATALSLPDETETLEDAFNSLADEYGSFDDPGSARVALRTEPTRYERFDKAFSDTPN